MSYVSCVFSEPLSIKAKPLSPTGPRGQPYQSNIRELTFRGCRNTVKHCFVVGVSARTLRGGLSSLCAFLRSAALTGALPNPPAFSSPPGCRERCGKSSAIQAAPPVRVATRCPGDAHRPGRPASSRSAAHTRACGNAGNDRKNRWRKRDPHGFPTCPTAFRDLRGLCFETVPTENVIRARTLLKSATFKKMKLRPV